MYEIIKNRQTIALTEQVNYIRLHPDGFYLLCREEEAQGVAVAGTPYHLQGREELPGCETVLVQKSDAGVVLWQEQLMNSQLQAAAKLYVQAMPVEDKQALDMPDLFRTWEEVLAAGQTVSKDIIINDGGKLYRVVPEEGVTPQENQPPHGEGMLAVYRLIDIEHAGTQEDPISYVDGIDTEQGKYYSYNDKLYLCNLEMTPCVWPPDTAGLWQWTEVVRE